MLLVSRQRGYQKTRVMKPFKDASCNQMQPLTNSVANVEKGLES